LTGCVEVRKISRPQVLPFGILFETFLLIGLDPVSIPLSIFAHAWLIPVCTDDNVLAVTKFQQWVWAVSAVASKELFTTPSI
jgi:hypothetical protein